MFLLGDTVKVLQAMKDNTIQCVVTSPPYWGLRDYKTATWEGGDSSCSHVGKESRTVSGGAGKQYTNAGSNRVYSGDCECGAIRKDRQLGLEATPELYVASMVAVFRAVRRVLRKDGTCWLNLGDSYAREGGNTKGVSRHWDGRESDPGGQHDKRPNASLIGLKQKDLVGIPWRVAFALQADGWWLRSDIIWSKPNPMPESVTDRPTKAHEYLFLMTKSASYYYNAEAIREEAVNNGKVIVCGPNSLANNDRVPGGNKKQDMLQKRTYTGFNERWENRPVDGRNRRTVWEIATQPYPEAHFATFHEKLIEPCILAGSKPGDIVLDPFSGSGTTVMVAEKFGRRGVGIELNHAYIQLAQKRCYGQPLSLGIA